MTLLKESINKLTKATNWARLIHKGQLRSTGEHYICHLIDVCDLVRKATGDKDELLNLYIASVLHDTIEDTGITYEDIEFNFGSEVAMLVLECTKPYKSLKSRKALIIKCADMLDNASDKPKEDWVANKCNMIRKTNRCS